MRNFGALGSLFTCMMVIGCAADATVDPLAPRDAGESPEWVAADPERLGLDSETLALARTYAFRDDFHTQAVLVVKDGYLVAEWYAEDSGPDSLVASWSIGKSFVSTLIGMAHQQGEIASLDEPMTTYVPSWTDTDKAPITLRDVLAMSSGLDWIEDYERIGSGDDVSDIAVMMLDANPLDVVLTQPVRYPPGEDWYYSSGDSMLLGHVLRQTTGTNATQWGMQQLAEPLHFSRFEWWQDGNGDTYTFCCVDATARDFAKFGQLFLQRGAWGGTQLLSADWVDKATTPQAADNPGYGFQWWLNQSDSTDLPWPSLPDSAYFAIGVDHQYVAVFPEQNMVVVRHGQYIVPPGTDWIAENGLFSAGMFSHGLAPVGTRGPGEEWSEEEFFGLILDAIND